MKEGKEEGWWLPRRSCQSGTERHDNKEIREEEGAERVRDYGQVKLSTVLVTSSDRPLLYHRNGANRQCNYIFINWDLSSCDSMILGPGFSGAVWS